MRVNLPLELYLERFDAYIALRIIADNFDSRCVTYVILILVKRDLSD